MNQWAITTRIPSREIVPAGRIFLRAWEIPDIVPRCFCVRISQRERSVLGRSTGTISREAPWQFRFWLEWDRDTMNGRDLTVKFASYAHYLVRYTKVSHSKAATAKGHASGIYEGIPAGTSNYLFPSRTVTVQFWTEQEESIDFHCPTFQGNPETTARSIPVFYDPARPSEAKIRSFEGLWLTSGLVMVIGVGLSLLFTALFVSVLR